MNNKSDKLTGNQGEGIGTVKKSQGTLTEYAYQEQERERILQQEKEKANAIFTGSGLE